MRQPEGPRGFLEGRVPPLAEVSASAHLFPTLGLWGSGNIDLLEMVSQGQHVAPGGVSRATGSSFSWSTEEFPMEVRGCGGQQEQRKCRCAQKDGRKRRVQDHLGLPSPLPEALQLGGLPHRPRPLVATAGAPMLVNSPHPPACWAFPGNSGRAVASSPLLPSSKAGS